MRQVSCGIILANPAGWLICHSTNNAHWDFPKGLREDGEDDLVCALREFSEETSFPLKLADVSCLTDLERHPYNKQKDLHLFYAWCDWIINADALVCQSTFTHQSGVVYPEMDRFDVLPPPLAIPRLSNSMYHWVHNHVPYELIER